MNLLPLEDNISGMKTAISYEVSATEICMEFLV